MRLGLVKYIRGVYYDHSYGNGCENAVSDHWPVVVELDFKQRDTQNSPATSWAVVTFVLSLLVLLMWLVVTAGVVVYVHRRQ